MLKTRTHISEKIVVFVPVFVGLYRTPEAFLPPLFARISPQRIKVFTKIYNIFRNMNVIKTAIKH